MNQFIHHFDDVLFENNFDDLATVASKNNLTLTNSIINNHINDFMNIQMHCKSNYSNNVTSSTLVETVESKHLEMISSMNADHFNTNKNHDDISVDEIYIPHVKFSHITLKIDIR